MTVKTITNFGVLLRLAKKMGKAEIQFLKGEIPASEFLQAKQEHDEYKTLCLKADQMATGISL